jgi:hypothetical protein
MVALSGTLLVVYQICAAEHDISLFPRGDTCIFPKLVMSFSINTFLGQFLVFCVAFCGFMVWNLSNLDIVCVGRARVLLRHRDLRK